MANKLPKQKTNDPSNVGMTLIDAAICNALSIFLTGTPSTDAAKLSSFSNVNESLYAVLNKIVQGIDSLSNNSSTEKSDIKLNDINDSILKVYTSVDSFNSSFLNFNDILFQILNDNNSKLIIIIDKLSKLNNINSSTNKLQVELTGSSDNINSLYNFLYKLKDSDLKSNVDKLKFITNDIAEIFDSLSKIKNAGNIKKLDLSWILDVVAQLNTIKLFEVLSLKIKLTSIKTFLLNDLIDFRNEILNNEPLLNEETTEYGKSFGVLSDVFNIIISLKALEDVSIIKSKIAIFKIKHFIVSDIIGLINKVNKKYKINEKENTLNSINTLFKLLIILGEKQQKIEKTINWIKKLKLDKTIKSFVKTIMSSFTSLNKLADLKIEEDKIKGNLDIVLSITKNINKVIYTVLLSIVGIIVIGALIISKISNFIAGLVSVGLFYYSIIKLLTIIGKLGQSIKDDKVIDNINFVIMSFLQLAGGIVLINLLMNLIPLSSNTFIILGTAVVAMGMIIQIIKDIKIENTDVKNIDLIINSFLKIGLLITFISVISSVISWGDFLLSVGIIGLSIATVATIMFILSKIKIHNVNNIDTIINGFIKISVVITVIALIANFLSIGDLLKAGVILYMSLYYIAKIIKISNSITQGEIKNLKNLVIASSITLLITTGIALISKYINFSDIGKAGLIILGSIIYLGIITIFAKVIKTEDIKNLKNLVIISGLMLLITTGIALISKVVNFEDVGIAIGMITLTTIAIVILSQIVRIFNNDSIKILGYMMLFTAESALLTIALFMLSKIPIIDVLKGGGIMYGTIAIIGTVMYLINLLVKKSKFSASSIKHVVGIITQMTVMTLLVYAIDFLLVKIGTMDLASLGLGAVIMVATIAIMGLIAFAIDKLLNNDKAKKKINDSMIKDAIKIIAQMAVMTLLVYAIDFLLVKINEFGIQNVLMGGVIMAASLGIIAVLAFILGTIGSKKSMQEKMKNAMIIIGEMFLITLLIFGMDYLIAMVGGMDITALYTGALVMFATVAIMGILIFLLGSITGDNSAKKIIKNAIVALISMIIFSIVAYAIDYIIANMIGTLSLDLIYQGGLVMIATIVIMGAIIYAIGFIMNKSKNIKKILAYGLGMIVGILAVTFIMKLAIENIADVGALNLEQLGIGGGILVATIGIMGAIIYGVGSIAKSPQVAMVLAIGAGVIAGIAGLILLISVAVKSVVEVATMVQEMPLTTNLLTNSAALIAFVTGMATGFIPLGTLTGFIVAGTLGIVALNKAVKAIAETINIMKDIPEDAINTEKNNKFENLINAYVEMAKVLKKNTFAFVKALPAAAAIAAMNAAIAPLVSTVAAYASLKYPTAFDDKGNPISYENLNDSKFGTVTDNIQKVLTVIIEAIKSLSEGEYGDMFKEGWFTKSPFAVFVNSSVKLGEMIANLAKGVQAFANLTYPIEWNEEGKPIKFENLDNDKMVKNVAPNIKLILTTVIDAIKDLSKGEYGDMFKEGWFTDSPYAVFVNSSVNLGKMISGLAQGVQAFANLTYPIEWNEEGKPIKFENLDTEKFGVVKQNIQDILTVMIGAIKDLQGSSIAGELFDSNFDKQGIVKTFMENCQNLGTMIMGIGMGVKAMSTLSIPSEWDKNGKPIKFISLSNEDMFPKVTKNIQDIITAIFNAITSVANGPNGKIFEPGFFKKGRYQVLMENSKGIGEMISGIAQGVVSFANLKIPGKYDENMTPEAALELNNKVFNAANTNIQNVLSTIFTAIADLLEREDIKKMLNGGLFGGDGAFKKLADGSKGISDLLMSSAKILLVYSTNEYPTKMDKDGNILEKVAFNIGTAKTNITNALSAILTSANDFITLNKEKIDKIPEYVKNLQSIDSVSNQFKTIIPKFAETIKKINEINVTEYNGSNIQKTIQVIKSMIVDLGGLSTTIDTTTLPGQTEKTNSLNTFFDRLFDSIKPYIDANNSNFEANVKTTKEYVKTINTLDVKKVDKLISLATQLNRLSNNMSIVQKVFTQFTTKIEAIVNKLIKNLTIVEKSINNSDKIQEKRKEIIKSTINEIQQLMNQKIEVQISSDTTDTEAPTTQPLGIGDTTANSGVSAGANAGAGLTKAASTNNTPKLTYPKNNTYGSVISPSQLSNILKDVLDHVVIKTKEQK